MKKRNRYCILNKYKGGDLNMGIISRVYLADINFLLLLVNREMLL